MAGKRSSLAKGYRVLVVDDQQGFLDDIKFMMGGTFDLTCVRTADEALSALAGAEGFHAVLLDFDLGHGDDGLALLDEIKRREPDVPVVMLSGKDQPANIVAAMCRGAADFVSKGPAPAELEHRIVEAVFKLRLARENRLLQAQVTESDSGMIGDSGPMRQLRAQIAAAAPGTTPVLILGETGTGKEEAFKELLKAMARLGGQPDSPHSRGDSRIPFRKVLCPARPNDEFRMVLFGSEANRFQNLAATPGVLEEVGDGVVFLDEFTEIPSEAQAQVLDVIEYRRYCRVGSTQERKFRGRFVAATRRNPEEYISNGRLRDDLYYRLCASKIVVPPLRAHLEDVPALVEHFIAQTCADTGLPRPHMDAGQLSRLCSYDWPGNVRQLQQIVSGYVRTGLIELHPQHETAAPMADLFGLPYHQGRALLLRRYMENRVRASMAAFGNSRTKAAHAMGVSRQAIDGMLKKLEQPLDTIGGGGEEGDDN